MENSNTRFVILHNISTTVRSEACCFGLSWCLGMYNVLIVQRVSFSSFFTRYLILNVLVIFCMRFSSDVVASLFMQVDLCFSWFVLSHYATILNKRILQQIIVELLLYYVN